MPEDPRVTQRLSVDPMPLMTGLLATAVMIAQIEVERLTEAERLELAGECGQYIAEHGDDLLFRSPRKGDSAKAFAKLARGLAAASFQPGGVTFAGEHWCRDHGECVRAAAAAEGR